MKQKIVFVLLQIILAGLLLVGLLLIWASLQSYPTLASLLNPLAADGKLEAFSPFLYKTLKLPFTLIGATLAALAGIMLVRWKKTKAWIQGSPTWAKQFLTVLGKDTQGFVQDAKNGITKQGWPTIAALFGLMFVALVLRLKNLNIPLGHDEAYMYEAFASRSIWHIVSDYHLPNNHVLLSILMKLSTGLLGNHLWTLRLPTIVTGVLIVPTAYFFAKRFFRQETAILSSILVAIFPTLIEFSVVARGYIIIVWLTLLVFTLADYVRVQKNRFVWLLIVFLSALGFYTIPIMLFPFGAIYIWLIGSWVLGDTSLYEPKSSFLKYWLGSGITTALLTIILYAPILIFSFDRFFGNGFIAPVGWDVFPVTLWTRLRNAWVEWTASIPLWIVFLGILGFLVAFVFHKKFTGQKFPPQIAFLIWILTLLLVRRPDMLPRFWLFLVGPLLVWMAAGVMEPLIRLPVTIGNGWNPAKILVTAFLALLLIQSFWMIPSLPSQLQKKDDTEKATLYLKGTVHQGDLVTASTALLPPLRYYFNYYGIPKGSIRQSGDFKRAFVVVDSKHFETLAANAPHLGFDIPAVDMDTAKIVYDQNGFMVYECVPIQ
jgi:hypothetical protein